MIMDILALFNDQTSIAAYTVAGSPYRSASYDTGVAGTPPAGVIGQLGGPLLHDLGRGRPLFLDVQITTAVTSGGAASLEADFTSADTADLQTTNPTVILAGPAVPKATLVAGYRYPFKTVPAKIARRYCGISWTVTTNDLTGGKVTSGMLFNADDHADMLGAP